MDGDDDRGAATDNELGIPGLADLQRFATGSSSVVYRAQDLRHGRVVAVKVLHQGTVDGEDELALERELAAMGRLSTHPNIIDLYGSGTTVERHPYIIMPYYSRGNYAELVDENGSLSWPELIDFGIKIAGALQTAHVRGFVHRDVKPANIFRGEFDRQPILADFGIASFANPGVGGSLTVKISATPLYAAPEVLESERPTERSDLYSLGASLFALAEGSPAFADPSTDVVVHRVTAAKVPPRPAVSMPSDLVDLLSEMMARDPQRRPSSCLAVAQRLVKIQKAEGIDPTAIVSDGSIVKEELDVSEGSEEPFRSVELNPPPEPRPKARIEPIVDSMAGRPPSSTWPVGSLDRPTEPAADLPGPRRPGGSTVVRVRPAWQWALLATVGLLVAALAYTVIRGSGPNPGELVGGDADESAAATFRAAWNGVGEPTEDWAAHPSSWVTDLAFEPGGPGLATAGTDGAVTVWPWSAPDQPTAEFEFSDWVIDVDWSADGERLAVAVTDGTVAIAQAAGGGPEIVDRRPNSAEAVAWDPSGARLLAGYAGGTVVVHSIDDGTSTVLAGHEGDLLDLDWSPTGDRAVSSSKDGWVIVWDTDSTMAVAVIENNDRLWTRSVQWVAATLFLTVEERGTVTLWSIDVGGDTAEELSRIDVGATVLAADLWLDNSVLLAAAYEDGSVRIWDLVSGDEAADLTPERNGEDVGSDDAPTVRWSGDGRALAVGRLDGSVQIWALD